MFSNCGWEKVKKFISKAHQIYKQDKQKQIDHYDKIKRSDEDKNFRHTASAKPLCKAASRVRQNHKKKDSKDDISYCSHSHSGLPAAPKDIEIYQGIYGKHNHKKDDHT
jgi:hypothetical protein